jgi:hypothetical protein
MVPPSTVIQGREGRETMADHITTVLTEAVRDYAEMLDEQIRRGVIYPGDFESLALTGEELRRMVIIAEGLDGFAAEALDYGKRALAGYDELLPECRALVDISPSEYRTGVEIALNDLELDLRIEGDEDFVVKLAEAIYLAVAGARAGLLKDSFVIQLGRLVNRRVRAAAPQLGPEIWSRAERRTWVVGPDERFPGLYDWEEELAQLSPERLDLGVMVAKQ